MHNGMKTVRIGTGAGYSGDRIEPAVELAEHGDIDYLVFECLAERTISIAQSSKQKSPESGYDPLLDRRMKAVLEICEARGVRIVSNMGAANPIAAARKTQEIAISLGIRGLKIAAVSGDDVFHLVADTELELDIQQTPRTLGPRLISANAYLGAGVIAEALASGADIVLCGRVADPALFLGPLIHEFGWRRDDWDMLGQGIVVGHLMECAGQVTGGYFADPGVKDVSDLARLGFPIAEVREDGELILSKVDGSGGRIDAAIVKEQLLYEIHDPSAYYQPDVIADFTEVTVEEIGPDRVRVIGGRGRSRTGLLKTSIGYLDSYVGEGQISYAGPGAVERGRLALEIIRERLRLTDVRTEETRFDLIGLDSLHGPDLSRASLPYEVRVRVTGRTAELDEAIRIGNEVEALYTNGPAGGGGAWKSAREVIAVASGFIPEGQIKTSFTILET
jgi:hypothetical protein